MAMAISFCRRVSAAGGVHAGAVQHVDERLREREFGIVVEPTGADTQVFTKIAGVEVTSVFRERHDFKPGETIRLKPDVTRAHLFDASSGQSLAI